MDDPLFEQLTRDLLDGRPIDWEALERDTPADARGRLHAFRAVAEIASGARNQRRTTTERWGPFELIEPIGHGTCGEVWRAHDPHLDRDVALKLLPAEDALDSDEVLHEGRLLARVRHPNVATIYNVTRVDDEIGVVMEFIPGDDLHDLVRQHGALDGAEVMTIGIQIARALEAVHRAGVLHRDVKASNVKRTADGRAILLDFGSSRELLSHATAPVEEAGTPLYLAPEVLAGQPASVQSDLYSLGVLLYYLATARYPIEARTLDELKAGYAASAPGGAVNTVEHLPGPLAEFLKAALAHDSGRRPRSAADAAARLSARRSPRLFRAAIVTALGIGAVIAGTAYFADRGNLTHGPLTATARRLNWTMAPATIGRASRDGRVLPFANRTSGALCVMTVETGAIDILTGESPAQGQYAGMSVASSDGRYIAYQWHGGGTDQDELRSIDVATRTVTTLWRAPAGVEVKPNAWSLDGSTVAGTLEHEDDTSDIFVIRQGSEPRMVASGRASNPSFNDDAHLIAFEKRSVGSDDPTIWITNVQTGVLSAVATGGDGYSPAWAGSTLLFISDRLRISSLFAVKVTDAGAAEAPAWRVTATDRISDLHQITADGSAIFSRPEGGTEIMVARADGSQPVVVSNGGGNHFSPDWTPDGQSIAWISEPQEANHGPLNHVFSIRDLRSGHEQRFDRLGHTLGLPRRIGMNPRFSPDGSRVLLRSADGGFFLANPVTGEESARFLAGRNFGDVEWDRDVEHVFFLDFARGVFLLNLSTGEETPVAAPPPGTVMGRGIAVSPDKSQVAFVTSPRGHPERATIMLVGRTGTGLRPLFTRQLTRLPATPFFAAVPLLLGEWTRDGRSVLFAATDVLPNGFVKADTLVWAVETVGGGVSRTGLSAVGLRDIRPNPVDGRIAFTRDSGHRETWIERDILRTDTVAR